MGKNCWFIFINPLWEYVWRGMGLGRAIFSRFSFVKRILFAFENICMRNKAYKEMGILWAKFRRFQKPRNAPAPFHTN